MTNEINRRRNNSPADADEDAEVDGWLSYFGRLTPRELVLHMCATETAAEGDQDPMCREGVDLTMAILRLYLIEQECPGYMRMRN